MDVHVRDQPAVIARVEPLTRTRNVRGPFDYRLLPTQHDVVVGSVVRVPFGRQRALGVVVGLADESEVSSERLTEPEAVLPAGLPRDLVELAGWMAAEYCSTPARALGLLLPPGAAQGVGHKRVLIAGLTEAGRAALRGAARLTDRQRGALERLEREGRRAAGELGTATLRRLEDRGLVELQLRAQRRRPVSIVVGARQATPPPLTGDQCNALTPLLEALGTNRGHRTDRRFLLHGVTGSGKTEVYLRAVEAALAAGRGAIVLVPEIALTPQTLGRFQARFGEVIAVLHSALARGERHDEWQRLRRGEARVCVGPRSAVLAPLENIGLIVVDEEHDGSYKHEGDPRYDARTVAVRRAQAHGAVLLAGTATPRPESVLSMQRLRLPDRIDRRPLPPVDVLDMRGRHHPLHPLARMALAEVRRARQKAIVLLNRRGWSNFLSCRRCGEVWMCPNCDVALVMHGREGMVACHHCYHRERVPDRCGRCGSVALARHGAGTERVEHELRDALGDAQFPIFRVDADTAAGKGGVARTLARFHSADAGVLVGTQMVAKGHDFANVTLGLVLDADQTLRFPDFRSEERAFALITQLAGRVGRGSSAGRVLVQTMAPSARSIEFAARHDADGFIADELGRREALEYPPYATLIRVVCSAVDAERTRVLASELRGRIAVDGATVLGPAPLFRLRGRARTQLVVKSSARSASIQAVGNAVNALTTAATRHGVSISVDVDPQ